MNLTRSLPNTVTAHTTLPRWDKAALLGPVGCLARGEYTLAVITAALYGGLAGLATTQPLTALAVAAFATFHLGFALSLRRTLRMLEAGWRFESDVEAEAEAEA